VTGPARRLLLGSVVLSALAAGGAACGGEREAVTVTVTTRQAVTVEHSTTVTRARTVTRTKTATVEAGAGRAAAPGAARARDRGPTAQFRGNGDRTLPPLRVRRGGSTLRWRTSGSVFALFGPSGTLVDSVDSTGSRPHSGSTYLRAGSYILQVVANGRWSLSAANSVRE